MPCKTGSKRAAGTPGAAPETYSGSGDGGASVRSRTQYGVLTHALLEALRAGPLTCAQLAQATGAHLEVVYVTISRLHGRGEVVRDGWARSAPSRRVTRRYRIATADEVLA